MPLSLRKYLRYARRLLRPSGAVQQRAVLGGFWEAILNVSDRVLQLVKLFVLARLLTPSDFGLFGIALLTAASIKWFTKLGIREALIQKSAENIDEYLDTAFYMFLGRGIFIAAIVAFSAPLIASFFGEPRATNLIRAVAIGPILAGFRNPGVIYFRKDLEFHKKFLLTFAGTTANVGVAITFALLYQSVWALIFGYLAGNAVGLIVSYVVHSYRPSFDFQIAQVRELFGYGKWLTVSGILLFLVGQGDDVFVGWFLGATALGFYRVAYRIGNAPGGEIAEIISNVAFPAYSKLQDAPTELQRGYFKTLQFTVSLSFPASFGIVVVAEPFTRIFLGTQWLPMVPALQLLALYSMLLTVSKINNSVLNATGRPDIATKCQFIKLLVIAVFIFPATDQFGIAGTAAVIVLGALVSELPKTVATLSKLEAPFERYILKVLPPLMGSAVMAVGIYGFQRLVQLSSVPVIFILSVILGIGLYTSLMALADNILNYGLLDLVKGLLNQFNTSS